MRKLALILTMTLLGLGLGGCGQKGPLQRPQAGSPAESIPDVAFQAG